MSLHVEIIPVTLFRQNCTLMWDDETNEAVFTDVGGKVPQLMEEAAKRGLNVKAVWLTHGHLDHVSGVAELTALNPSLEVLGPHENDRFLLANLTEITKQYNFPPSKPFIPTRWLEEGDTLNVGKYGFKVLHIPGHTPGHIVFYCAEAGLLVAGDVIFYESIGRTDFERSSHDDLIKNIREKIFTLPDDTEIITGHGRTTTVGYEKLHNPYL
ncbi:hydroxyacylglutathione hydrolase [Kingella potus]|uniref:Hydroxyacylglutathione hydrolase n=1 Tax=Kingella potus TaxID=265175 RepID=A0A377QZT6_9NEIS|nr:MBL fold metallo-hydrolase [Kingella potus]STR00886.1 hydroxyacylglutathione hydrolase [Kingella potus]